MLLLRRYENDLIQYNRREDHEQSMGCNNFLQNTSALTWLFQSASGSLFKLC